MSNYQKGFRVSPVFVCLGGTIPPVSAIQELLNIPIMMLGFALPDDRLHSPNERFYLPNFFKGIATRIWFLEEIAKSKDFKYSFAPYDLRCAGDIRSF